MGGAAARAAEAADREHPAAAPVPALPQGLRGLTGGRRRLRTGAAVAAALLLGLTGAAAGWSRWERQLVFQAQARATTLAAVDAAGFAYDLDLEDGERLHAWWIPAPGSYPEGEPRSPAEAGDDTGVQPEPPAGGGAAPTVLFLHGARKDLEGNAARVEAWHRMGFNVLAIDYRGFGRSTPILPSEQSVIADARRAMAELNRREPDPGRRFLYGHSLGGAVAIAVAADGPADAIAGLIVESSFTSLREVVAESRWGWVPGARWLVRQQFDSRRRIGAVGAPLLLLHGTRDRIVPHTMSDRLLDAAHRAPPGARQMVKFEGAGHRGIFGTEPAAYRQAVLGFVALASERAGRPGR